MLRLQLSPVSSIWKTVKKFLNNKSILTINDKLSWPSTELNRSILRYRYSAPSITQIICDSLCIAVFSYLELGIQSDIKIPAHVTRLNVGAAERAFQHSRKSLPKSTLIYKLRIPSSR